MVITYDMRETVIMSDPEVILEFLPLKPEFKRGIVPHLQNNIPSPTFIEQPCARQMYGNCQPAITPYRQFLCLHIYIYYSGRLSQIPLRFAP